MNYKKISFFISFFLCLNIFSQENEGIITYNVNLNFTLEDILKEEEKQKKQLRAMRDIITNASNSEVILSFKATESIYTVSKKMRINEEKNGRDFVYSRAGREKVFYTNLITNTTDTQECLILGKCYLIKQPKPEWELTQETKIIGGYLCYKAINIGSKNKKKKPIAWYTPKISAGFGPKQYFGLPGLILELEEAAVIFRAKEIVLNPKEKILLNSLEGEKISKEDYDKKIKEAYSDFYKN